MVYASENSSLALLETLVHTSIAGLPKSLVAVEIHVPDDVDATTLLEGSLPATWRELDDRQCVALGSAWIEANADLVLQVPSGVNPLERNVLLNPLHADIARCTIGAVVPIVYDPRLLALFRTPRPATSVSQKLKRSRAQPVRR